MVVGPDGRLPLPWLAAPLQQALDRLQAHAVLVHGPAGVGQFELAVALAQAWLCEGASEPGAARPCGRCTGCRLMQSHGHPDFQLLLPEALREPLGWGDGAEAASDGEGKKAKPSREIRIDAVRRAIDWAHRSSTRGQAKVIVIHPASAMNLVTANALLKTLEEPPGRLRLVLCVGSPEDLLPTVRSRCQRLALALPPADESLAWLQAQGAEKSPEAAERLLRAAGGQPLEALSLAQAGLDAAFWQRLPKWVARGEAGPLAGLPVPRVVEALQKLCHDLMLAAADAPPRYFGADDLPAGAMLPALAGWAPSLTRAARHAEHPWNAGLLIEALVSEARQVWKAAASPQDRVATLGAR